jgi:prefoldin subunit 5
MFDFETTLSGIEYKVRQLIEQNNSLKTSVAQLETEREELSETIKKKDEKIEELKQETEILKLRNTLVQKGDSAEIKLKINQMIRNIDKSLALLTKLD